MVQWLVKTLGIFMAQIQFLVRELRSRKLRSTPPSTPKRSKRTVIFLCDMEHTMEHSSAMKRGKLLINTTI